MKPSTIARGTGRTALYLSLAAIYLVPVWIILVNSFKSYAKAQKLGFGFESVSLAQAAANYAAVYAQSRLLSAYLNSFILTVLSVSLTIVAASMMAFYVNRRRGDLPAFLNFVVMVGLTLPLAIVPEYFILSRIRLGGTYLGTSLVYIAVSTPLAMYLYAGGLKSIPRSFDESAFLDGAHPVTTFFRIIFPLLLPVTAVAIIITSLGGWNDFSIALFLFNAPRRQTVTLSTYSYFSQKHTDWNLLFANVVLISLPVVILYFVLQRYIISGLTAGALKS